MAAVDEVRVRLELSQTRPALHVPNANGLIGRTREQVAEMEFLVLI